MRLGYTVINVSLFVRLGFDLGLGLDLRAKRVGRAIIDWWRFRVARGRGRA